MYEKRTYHFIKLTKKDIWDMLVKCQNELPNLLPENSLFSASPHKFVGSDKENGVFLEIKWSEDEK